MASRQGRKLIEAVTSIDEANSLLLRVTSLVGNSRAIVSSSSLSDNDNSVISESLLSLALSPLLFLEENLRIRTSYCQILESCAIQNLLALTDAGSEELVGSLYTYSGGKDVVTLRALGCVLMKYPIKSHSVVIRLCNGLIELLPKLPPVGKLDEWGYLQQCIINCIGNICKGSEACLSDLCKDIIKKSYDKLLEILLTFVPPSKIYFPFNSKESAVIIAAKGQVRIIRCLLRSLRNIMRVGGEQFFGCDASQLISICRFLSSLFQSVTRQSSILDSTELDSDRQSGLDSGSDDSQSDDHVKIRVEACLFLQEMARLAPKVMQRFWLFLVTEKPSILSVIEFDCTIAVKSAAASALSVLLRGSHQFLSAAVEVTGDGCHARGKSVMFTSHSASLASSIRGIHDVLCNTIESSNTNSDLVRTLLHCLSLLAENVSYERLKPELLRRSMLIAISQVAISGRSVAGLNCMTAILGTPKPHREIEDLLKPRIVDNVDSSLYCFLIGICVNALQPASVKDAALGGLISATLTYANVCLPTYWSMSFNLIKILFESKASKEDEIVRRSVVKFLDAWTKISGKRDNQLSMQIQVWCDILSSAAINNGFCDNSHPVRSGLVSCLGNLSILLPQDQMLQCWKLVSRAAVDSVASVRGASYKALGTMSRIDDSIGDINASIGSRQNTFETVAGFLEIGLRDSNMNSRIQASWALAELFEAILAFEESTGVICFSLFRHLSCLSLKLIADNDKIKTNIVRAIGLATKSKALCPLEGVVNDSILDDVVSGLVDILDRDARASGDDAEIGGCGGSRGGKTVSAKTWWNACYAAKCLLCNYSVYPSKHTWGNRLILVLVNIVKGSQYFKVRVNAAGALNGPVSITEYCGLYGVVLETVISSLRSIDDMSDYEFSEYQYKLALQSALRKTLAHLISLLDPAYLGLPTVGNDMSSLLQFCAGNGLSTCDNELLNLLCSKSLFIVNELREACGPQVTNYIKLPLSAFGEPEVVGVDSVIVAAARETVHDKEESLSIPSLYRDAFISLSKLYRAHILVTSLRRCFNNFDDVSVIFIALAEGLYQVDERSCDPSAFESCEKLSIL